MTRPSVADALPLVREQYHREALLMLDTYADYLTSRFGADEVERMRGRHREALLPPALRDPWSSDPTPWPELTAWQPGSRCPSHGDAVRAGCPSCPPAGHPLHDLPRKARP